VVFQQWMTYSPRSCIASEVTNILGMGRFVRIRIRLEFRGTRFHPRQRQEDFSCSLCVQTRSEAQPASCTMGTGGPFPGGKARPWRDADHSLPSSTEVKYE
jgi:hypothetical protein